MANQWFRMYSEFAHDPKVQMLSEVDQRRLIMIYCMRCSDSLENITDDEVCFVLRISCDELQQTKNNLIKKGLILENWNIPSWDNRQFLSDSSNERVKRYREKRKKSGLSCNGYTKHKEFIMSRDNSRCVYCNSEKNLCLDHILPISKGGNDDKENLAVACKECNSGKAGRTPQEAGMIILNKETESIWLSWLQSQHVTVTVTPPDTDTDTDTDTDIKDISLSNDKDTVDDHEGHQPVIDKIKPIVIPYQDILSTYHNTLPELSQVYQLTPTRRQKIKNLWLNELPSIEHWERYFRFVKKSDFLMGKVNGSQRPFKCSIDFLIENRNYIKICEDKYHG